MPKIEIQISGFGGQGIVLAGYIVGKAISIYDKKSASMTRSYGPEARGGACSSGVVVSGDDTLVDYPKVKQPDILITMSQEAYTTHINRLKSGGILIYDSDLVTLQPSRDDIKAFPVPATRLADEELGRRIVANVVMLGAFTRLTGLVSEDSMLQAIKTTVKKDYIDLNEKAFKLGLKAAESLEVGSHA